MLLTSTFSFWKVLNATERHPKTPLSLQALQHSTVFSVCGEDRAQLTSSFQAKEPRRLIGS